MTLRYPLKAPIASGEDFLGDEATGATGMIDYLKIKRKRTSYSTNGKNYYGSNANFITGAESVEGDLNSGTRKTYAHRTSCYIALPPGIQAQYQPVYRQVNLGVGGAAAIKALGSNDTSSLAANLQQAAQAILPEFGASAIAQGANAISGFFGVQGQLDANVLQGLTTGKVFNPYTEQLFSQMNFRNHSFAIKMLARNSKEAKQIFDIIRYVKMGAHPKISSSGESVLNSLGSGLDRAEFEKKSGTKYNDLQKDGTKKLKDQIDKINQLSGRFFELPDHFSLDYVRMNPDEGEFNSNGSMPLHYKMTDCVCSGVSVNYTPDNQYTSFKNISGDMIQVPAIILNLQFTEVKLLNQNDIASGF